MWLDIAVVCLYLAVLAAVGTVGGGRIRKASDFSAGGGFGTAVLFASLAASYIGGGYSAGNAAAAFSGGIGTTLALFGFGVSMILVGRFLVPGASRFAGCTTVGAVMQRCYGDNARIVTGVFSFLCCLGVVGAQIETMGVTCRVLFGLDETAGALIGFGVVLLYATGGGLQAVVRADVLQFILLASGLPLLLVLSLRQAGGVEQVLSQLPSGYLDPFAGQGRAGFWCAFLSMACGELLAPPYMQRILSGKSARSAARATVYSGCFAFPFFCMTGLLGLAAYVLRVTDTAAHALPALVMAVLPQGLRGLVMAAMVSVSLSAADGFLNSAAVALVGDVWVPLCRRTPSDGAQLRLMRLVTVLTGMGAVAAALLLPDVLGILMWAYSFWAPVLPVPLAAALLGVKASGRCFAAAAAAGLGGCTVWNLLLASRLGIDGTVPGLLCNLAAFAAVLAVDGRHRGVVHLKNKVVLRK